MYENNYPNSYNSNPTDPGTVNHTDYTQDGGNHYHYGTFSGDGNSFPGSGYQQSKGTGRSEKPRKSGSGFGKKIAIGICCGLCFGIFAGLGFQAVNTAADFLKGRTGGQAAESTLIEQEAGKEAETQQTAKAAVQAEDGQQVQTVVTDVSQVAKEVMPSVVSVNNKYVERMSFFGQEYSQEATGSGSGIIVGQNDTELLLVTNYHVVESAEELTVQFMDGTLSEAQVKGTDADKDLAVISVQLDGIDTTTMNQIAIARLGSSNDLTVGEPVVAIGNALGYGQSVTVGYVSALNRPIAASTTAAQQTKDTKVSTFIQTDAAINPGNSGGPLLNMNGEVIGINSNKIGSTAVEGMGYAIPISDVQDIIEDLMSKQRVDDARKGYLGIMGLDVVSEYSELYGAPRGVYVSKVIEGTGAADAGLVRGDIITAVNGKEIVSMSDLQEELIYYEAGTTIELTIMQGSPVGYQAKTVQVTLSLQTDNS